MNTIKTINSVLSLIQIHLKAPKDCYNAFGKYKFRNAQSVLENVKPMLELHGASLVLSDEIVAVGGRIYCKSTATLTVGNEEVSATAFAREAEEQKGMQPAQVSGSTSSYARKYALGGLLCLDDSDDDDATNAHGSASPAAKKTPPVEKPSGPTLEVVIGSINAQDNLADLDSKMEKAQNTSHKGDKTLQKAYEAKKEELSTIPY